MRKTTAARRLTDLLPGALQGIARQLFSLILAFLIVAVVLWVSGYNAGSVFATLLRSFVDDFHGMLRWATPLILTGLATAVAFRARIWNIGMDGQLYIGALTGTVVGLYVAPHLPGAVGIALVLLVSALGGALWALPAAILRVRWGVPEIITTILLIQVAALLVSWLVLGPLKGRGALGASLSSDQIPRNLWLHPLAWHKPATIGLYVSMVVAVFVGWYLMRSRHGFEIRTFGDNRQFSAYAGMSNRWIFVRTMMTSGALAGLAGGLELLGSMHRLPNDFAGNLGFQGVAVSLVAQNNPFAIIISGVFFGGLKNGGTSLQLYTDTPRDVVDVISAIVILVITARVGYQLFQRRAPHLLARFGRRRARSDA
ncbi:ABC transporter permease [Dactylosporangium sp. NPDC051485]|uniref:ABC transporter permease n=1 Tax=Dactylosporangium sp. NPDC051485 TaxID=3154846 RepID=UPI00342B62F7